MRVHPHFLPCLLLLLPLYTNAATRKLAATATVDSNPCSSIDGCGGCGVGPGQDHGGQTWCCAITPPDGLERTLFDDSPDRSLKNGCIEHITKDPTSTSQQGFEDALPYPGVYPERCVRCLPGTSSGMRMRSHGGQSLVPNILDVRTEKELFRVSTTQY